MEAHIREAAVRAASARINKSAGSLDGYRGELEHGHGQDGYRHAHVGGDQPHNHPRPDDHDPNGAGATGSRTGSGSGSITPVTTPTSGTAGGAGRSPLTGDFSERKPGDLDSPVWSKTPAGDLLHKGVSRAVRQVGSGQAAQLRVKAADYRATARTLANPETRRTYLMAADNFDREADDIERGVA